MSDSCSCDFSNEQFSRIGGKLVESLQIIRKAVHRYPKTVWEVGFSGGKDSTIICHLIFEYITQAMADGSALPSKIFIVHCDTLLDLPIFRKHALSTLECMAAHSKRFDGVVETVILKPAEGEDFFSMMIEKGYSSPHFRYRWCMGRLKIEPTLDFLCKIKNIAMITGVRKNESKSRKRNLELRNQRTPITEVSGTVMIAPLLNWKTQEVWDFLSAFKQPWNGESYHKLFDLYRVGDNLGGCGRCEVTPNSRFGCWVCTVVRRDRLLENFAPYRKDYKVMLEAKERIRQISLTPRLRSYKPDGSYKGLNRDGRLEVIKVLAEVLINAKEALDGYLETPTLKDKLINWLKSACKEGYYPLLEQALLMLRE